ncbi:MAG: hypothetical protein ACN4G0_16370 [Polyangiales bacterium]
MQYEIFIDIEAEEDLYDLLATEQISEASFDALLLLHQTRVDINRAGRQELYLLPNLSYSEVDVVLAYRDAAGVIADLDELAQAGVLGAKLANSIRAFVLVRDPNPASHETSGMLRVQSRWTGRNDRLPPASAVQARVAAIGNLDVAFAGVLTRNRLRRVRWDSSRSALSVSAESVRFEVPKVYAEWEDEDWEIVVGTYRIGFGQRLTFDVTGQVSPNGSFGDYELRRDNELERRCRRAVGELPASPCPGLREVRVTPDFDWTNRLSGAALGLKRLTLGRGWLQGYAWGSYQIHRASSIELVDATACDDPRRNGDPACAAPTVYVRSRDPSRPSSEASIATLPIMYAEGLAGANLSYFWNRRSHVGVTGYGSAPRWLVRGTTLGFQEFAQKPFGGPFGALGLDAAFGFRSQDFFVELARSFDTEKRNGGYAAVVRSVRALGSSEIDLSLRYYGADYANPYARPISAPDELGGLRARDETGIRLRATASLNRNVGLRAILDGWRALSSGQLNALLFTRVEWRATPSVRWASWVEYRNTGAQRVTLATRLMFQPLRAVALSGQLQYRWGGRLGSDRLQQDLAAIVDLTTRPIELLRLRVRVRYDFDDVWNNHRLPQTLWFYSDTSITVRERDLLRCRYDFRVFLDERESTLARDPNPEHWLWVEYVFRF